LPSTPPRSPLAGRIFSLLSLAAEHWHRARYRRAELRRIPAAGRHGAAAPEWDLSQPHLPVLTCAIGSAVAYDVTLAAGAAIETRCALRTAAAAVDDVEVEFTIDVEVSGRRWAAAALVASTPQSRQRRSRALRLTVPAAGAATLVLTTRLVRGSADGAVAAWSNPRVATPRPLRELYAAIRSAAAGGFTRGAVSGDRLYQLWMREQEPSRETLRQQREWGERQARLFTVITEVADPASWRDDRTAKSVASQSYPRWEWLLLVPEGAAFPAPPLGGDPRVRPIAVPRGASRADRWTAALRDARGEMACLLGAGDTVSASALHDVAAACERHPEHDLFYSDEDRIDAGGRRHTPRFKPSWSPDLLLSDNYVGRLAMMRVRSALAAGAFRNGCDGAEEWDLLLRLSRRSPKVHRLTQCLYHRRVTAPAGPLPAGPVRDHLLALGLAPTLVRVDGGDRVTWPLQGDPLVSVIIPNRNAAAVVRTCVDGLLTHTPSPRREIVIVDNGSTDPAVLELYREIERAGAGRIVPFDRPFNYSAACNAGAAASTGDFLLFLNNDIEVVDPGWLDELVRWAQRPEVGIVGGKLLYPDRLIQHAGVAFGIGLVGHIFARAAAPADGVFGSTESYRNYIAVTGACQMMRRDVFERLGGYDERYRLTFSDVVLCMNAWAAGYRVVYTPFARLIHHESYTRQRDESAEDMVLLARHLKTTGFVEDPYFHPHLDPKSPIPVVRPPFEASPRQVIADYVDRVLAAVPGV
jgi:GT2 family glycosyltransferase